MTRVEETIRRAVNGDPGWVISAHGRLYAEEFGFDLEFELGIARKMVAFHENPAEVNRIWIYEADGQRGGSIALSQRADHVAFLNFFLVEPLLRGRGIGEKLLLVAVEYARANAFRRVALETYSCLEAARRLYDRAGFDMVLSRKDVMAHGRTFDQEFWELKL